MAALTNEHIQLIHDRLPANVACFYSEFPDVLLKAARDAELPVRTTTYIPGLVEVFYGGQLETASVRVVNGVTKQYFIDGEFGDNRVTLVVVDGNAAYLQIDGRVGLDHMGGAYMPPKLKNAGASTAESLVRTYRRLHPERVASLSPGSSAQTTQTEDRGIATEEISNLSEDELVARLKETLSVLEKKKARSSPKTVIVSKKAIASSPKPVPVAKRRTELERLEGTLETLKQQYDSGQLTREQAQSQYDRLSREISEYQSGLRIFAFQEGKELPPGYKLKNQRSQKGRKKRGNKYTEWFWDFMAW